MPTAKFISWAAERRTAKAHWATLYCRRLANDAYGVAGVFSIHVADWGGYWSGSTLYIPPLMTGVPTIEHRISGIGVGQTEPNGGASLPGVGQISLIRRYDGVAPGTQIPWSVLWTSNYSFDGQQIVLKVGDPDLETLPIGDWATVLNGVLGSPKLTRNSVEIPIYTAAEIAYRRRMPLRKLEDTVLAWAANTAYTVNQLAFPTNSDMTFNYVCTVAGTTGATEPAWPGLVGATVTDGGVTWKCFENQDRPIPLLYGRCRNITPVKFHVGVEGGIVAYVIHDRDYGEIKALDAVYKDGVLLSPSEYVVMENGCVIYFPTDPGGTITIDARGVVFPGTSTLAETAGDILYTLLYYFANSLNFSSTARAALNAVFAYQLGLYITQWTTLGGIIDSLFSALPIYHGVRRDGAVFVNLFGMPSGTPVLTFSGSDEVSEDDITVEYDQSILYSVTVQGVRNWTVISNPGETVTPEYRDWLSREWSQRTMEDGAIRAKFPLAEAAGPHESALTYAEPCRFIAQALLDLHNGIRRIVTVTTKLQPLACELGDVVQVNRSGYGLSNWLGRVIGISENHNDNTITLTLWGA